MKRVNKTWGYENWIINTKQYGGKLLHCKYGKWSSQGKFHYHKEKDETFFVIRGTIMLDIKTRKSFSRFILNKGDMIRIKPLTKHRFSSLSLLGSNFIEFSTHYKKGDSYYD